MLKGKRHQIVMIEVRSPAAIFLHRDYHFAWGGSPESPPEISYLAPEVGGTCPLAGPCPKLKFHSLVLGRPSFGPAHEQSQLVNSAEAQKKFRGSDWETKRS